MANNFVIRRAMISEQRVLEELQMRASLTNAGDREALLAHPDAIQVPTEQLAAGFVFVAETDEFIAGFAAVLHRSDGDAELDALFVDPNKRRLGIARLLVEHSCDIARSRGGAFLHVIGNPHAREFYLACGFQSTGTSETRFGRALLTRKPV